jgi:D-lactate dehydrogenase (cytochrome)
MIRAIRLPECRVPQPVCSPEILESYLEDASGAPAGHAAGLLRLESEAEASAYLRGSAPSGQPVLAQAARSSLTGGSIPQGEVVLSVERMRAIGPLERCGAGARVRVQPGIRLEELQEHLASQNLFFPPVPTYQKAMLGGTVSTNAGGAATFKYGVTRHWVRGLRVLLFNGDLLEVERGQHRAAAGGEFLVRLSDGRELSVPVPNHRLPPLKKISAGYHSADPLDLVDLLVGSEGTLGLVTEVTLDLAPLPAAVVTGLVFPRSERTALDLAADLRRAAESARAREDPLGPDLRAIEFADANCLSLLRESGAARERRVPVPAEAGAMLLLELELPRAITDRQAVESLGRLLDGKGSDGPLARLVRILERHEALDDLQLAFPEDGARRRALYELREAVPLRVNELHAQLRGRDPAVKKVGGDLIVPFERLSEALRAYRVGFERRGLRYAIWGHLSDGNLHPNALPRDAGEVGLGFEALLEFAELAARLGGCPLSEHGVGRSPIKQEILRRFLGRSAVDRMKRVKGALDPPWRFAPGVLFPAAPSGEASSAVAPS